MTDTPERELIEHDHVAEACERLRDRDWPSFTPDQIVHVRIGDIRALLSRVDKLEEALSYGTVSMTKRMVVIDFDDRKRAEAMFDALNRSAF
jgi:hypothetical protein